MEGIILSLVLGSTVVFTARYLKSTVKHGEVCQSCPSSKGGCSKTMKAHSK